MTLHALVNAATSARRQASPRRPRRSVRGLRADRVAVLDDGRLPGPFPRAEVDRERIGALMAEDGDRDG